MHTHANVYCINIICIPSGVVQIKLEVSYIGIDQCEGETWIRSYRRKILMLYTIILRDEKDLLQRLNFRTFVVGVVGVKFVRIAVASIVLHVELTDADSVSRVEEFVSSDKFAELINDVIVTQALLAELGASQLNFFVHVNRDDIARCKRNIVSLAVTSTATTTPGMADVSTAAGMSKRVASVEIPSATNGVPDDKRDNCIPERGQGKAIRPPLAADIRLPICQTFAL